VQKKPTFSQSLVSSHENGHAIVRAVAGSGKTTTLMELIKNLIKKGIRPTDITMMVFNKDAKKDISLKLSENFGGAQAIPKVYTFHALAFKLYNFFYKRGKLPYPNLEVNDLYLSSIASRALNEVLSLQAKKKVYAEKEEVDEFLSFIDISKATLMPPSEAFDQWVNDPRYKHFIKALARFEFIRKEMGIITYSDLIKDVVLLCKRDERAALQLKGFVNYLLLDEVQDINEISIELAKLISNNGTKWVMVGDIDQCIYQWRGADPTYLAYRLREELSSTNIVREYDLPETFRYGHLVSLMSNHLLSNNASSSSSLCISSPFAKETTVDVAFYKDLGRFGERTANYIKEENERGTKFKDISVLVRLYSFASEIELSLLRKKIPYTLEGGTSVFEQKEIQALLTILELNQGVLFFRDNQTITKMLNCLFSIVFFGVRIKVTEDAIEGFRNTRGGLSQHILSHDTPTHSKYKRDKLQDLASLMRIYDSESSAKLSSSKILSLFIRQMDLHKTIDLFSVRQEVADNKTYTIKSFMNFISTLSKDPSECLKEIELLKSDRGLEEDRVVISTVHRAKGREWPVVIMPGLEDGLFPYTKKANAVDVESERRLFYVGTTRCINKIVYICPHEKALIQQMQGGREYVPPSPIASRFIYESKIYSSTIFLSQGLSVSNKEQERTPICKKYINKFLSLQEPENGSDKTRGNILASNSNLHEGMAVQHQIYGTGKVIARTKEEAVIAFNKGGIKTININHEAVEFICE